MKVEELKGTVKSASSELSVYENAADDGAGEGHASETGKSIAEMLNMILSEGRTLRAERDGLGLEVTQLREEQKSIRQQQLKRVEVVSPQQRFLEEIDARAWSYEKCGHYGS